MTKKIKYEAALKELMHIQEALENNEISVDELSGQVRRARELLEHCQRMLKNTQNEVDKILGDEKES